nr:PTS system mannose/fructose/sorbose family transporter subunit IID [uncultured Caproiciproducens sp.]
MADKKLSASTLKKIFWNWLLFNGCSQSGERMQGIAFAQAMTPAIEELYGESKEETVSALKRHLVLFNVEPQLGSIIPGVTAALEEQRANGADLDDDTINTIKVALMGPLSGIGDTLIPGTLVPILLAISIGITQAAGVFGPLFYMVVYPVITILYAWFLFKAGYNTGLEGIHKIMGEGTIDIVTTALNILGLLVMGALGAGYISLSTKLAFTSGKMTVQIQKILDSIMPNLLPLALTFFVYWLLSKKKKSPIFVMAAIFIVAAIGVLLGIF